MDILKNICIEIKDGDWIESKDQSEEGIRLVQTGNIGNGIYLEKNDRAKYISEYTFDSLKCTEIFEGDVLISRLPSPVGRCCLFPNIDKRAITAVDCTIVRLNKNKCLPKYFVYYTRSDLYSKQINKFVVGTTRLRISRKNLENINVFLHPLETQEKIIKILDKAQELIYKRKEQIKALDELVKSKFIEMFGDPVVNPKGWKCDELKNVTLKITDGKHGDCENEESSGYYFISAKDINDRKINTENSRQITKKDFNETNKRTMLKAGDIVIVNTGATIGKTAIATTEDVSKNLTFQKSVAIVTVDSDRLLSEFLEQFIIFDRDRIYNNASGSAQKNWLLSQMRSYKIILPPVELQTKFVNFVKEVDKLKFEMEKSLKELEDNFNSLMQKAFKGELFN